MLSRAAGPVRGVGDDAKCFSLPQLAPAVPSPAVRDRVVLSGSSARHVFSLEDPTSDGKLLCEL